MLKTFAVAVVLMSTTASSQAMAATSAANGEYVVADIRPPYPGEEREPKSRDTRPAPPKPADPVKRPTRPEPNDGATKPDNSSSSTTALIVAVLSAIAIGWSLRRRPMKPTTPVS